MLKLRTFWVFFFWFRFSLALFLLYLNPPVSFVRSLPIFGLGLSLLVYRRAYIQKHNTLLTFCLILGFITLPLHLMHVLNKALSLVYVVTCSEFIVYIIWFILSLSLHRMNHHDKSKNTP